MTHRKDLRTHRASQTVDVQFTPRPRSAANTKPSRKRALASMFAIMGVVAFGGAFAIPAGAALAGTAPEAQPADSSLYDAAVAGAQQLIVDDVVVVAALDRSSSVYEAYVTPTPTPTPTPEKKSSSSSGSSGSYSPPSYSGGGSKEDWLAAAGIAQSDWGYVDYIVSRESGWNPNATNSSSGACGLVQVYPCGKIDNAYDPVVNLTWANGYATGRYGSWAGAYEFWTTNHWW
ncbi:transglycosylase SLT domain-containing protein [Microbacterium sp. YY-03]|uniref:aggregation-promoting factor C-terminal-like domain-containing protein n=1 Tax=Microbacterium sp. YY-03 TaxID=3421636 RepID=UPI003D177B80